MATNKDVKKEMVNMKKELTKLRNDMSQMIEDKMDTKIRDIIEPNIKRKFKSLNFQLGMFVVVIVGILISICGISYWLIEKTGLDIKALIVILCMVLAALAVIAILSYSFMELMAVWNEK